MRKTSSIVASLLLLGLFILLACVPAFAQSSTPATVTQVDVLILPPTGNPLTVAPIAARSTLISATSANCNLTPSTPPPTPLVNPTTVVFDDPWHQGQQCSAAIPTGLAIGTGYRAVGIFEAPSCTNAAGVVVSPCLTARSDLGIPPFNVASVLTTPAAPTGVGVRP